MTQIYKNATPSEGNERHPWASIARGLRGRCPGCGEGAMFRRYLKPADSCAQCGEELHHHRADDAPPYITILVVGHVIVALVLLLESTYHPPAWVHGVVWTPLAVGLALVILPIAKGGLIGLQWALRMHGFDQSRRGGDDGEALIVDDGQRQA